MSDPALIIESLGHAFGCCPVLDGISCRVEPGELLAVLGPSGCGKSTLLRAVAGLLDADRGRIVIGGETVFQDGRSLVPVERRRVGLVFQDYALFAHLSVGANVAFGLPRARRGEVEELLALVGLAGFADRRPEECSGGQQQRVAVARALAPHPRLMLLDEPFANLDLALRDDLGVQIRALLIERDTAGLLVTHDRHDALGLADRVLVLLPHPSGARIAQCASPDELYRCPANAAIARLCGPVVELPGQATGDRADTPLGTLPVRSSLHGPVDILARPEELAFVPDHAGALTVIGSRFLGPCRRLLCRWIGGTLELDAPAGQPPPRHDSRGRLTARHPLWAVAGAMDA